MTGTEWKDETMEVPEGLKEEEEEGEEEEEANEILKSP